ncbi:hypothetical protein B7463_g8241, partial [Scytalidium lignicola]
MSATRDKRHENVIRSSVPPAATMSASASTKQPCPGPGRRPTKAIVESLRAENEDLRSIIAQLQGHSVPEDALLSPGAAGQPADGLAVQRQTLSHTSDLTSISPASSHELAQMVSTPKQVESTERDKPDSDVSPFLSMDERGNLDSFGPSSAIQSAMKPPVSTLREVEMEHIRNGLFVNAVLSRQSEHRLLGSVELTGVSADLALHLLDLHWHRQHHTFLLTYRPAIMRDLLKWGPFASPFLINAILACSSKYSHRNEVRDDHSDPRTAGGRFFRRCDELMSTENLLLTPSLPIMVGLLLLGSTYNAQGLTSKGWLLTGYALRMVYDLGLHLNRELAYQNAEDVEIRRRVFWGAFVCDKLQSLYLGRPVAIKLRDTYVSLELNDTMEENELWTPYINPAISDGFSIRSAVPQGPIHSVSCFQHFCLLSKIMTQIIDEFYVIGATAASARASIQVIDNLLNKWKSELPEGLRLDPIAIIYGPAPIPAPNILILHVTYYALIILLYRPLVADGHLRSASAPVTSWKRCTEAARNITHVAVAYRSAYTLRGAPYLVSYGLYVACTIHVRNAAAEENKHTNHSSLLLSWSVQCLEELSIPNPGVSRPVRIIRKLMSSKGVTLPNPETHSVNNLPEGLADKGTSDFQAPGDIFSSRFSGFGAAVDDATTSSNGWQESFEDDVLYGFMDGQLSNFGDLIPMMSENPVLAMGDAQNVGGQIIDAYSSIKRIQEFLVAEEVEDDTEWHLEIRDATVVQHISFTWERTRTEDESTKLATRPRGEKSKQDKTTKNKQTKIYTNSHGAEKVATAITQTMSNRKEPFELHDISLTISRNKLIAVISPVSSRKSSLLTALAEEMRYTSGKLILRASRRAFCTQYTWIQNTNGFGRPGSTESTTKPLSSIDG